MLFAIHARSIIRTSSKDPGRLAIWLVEAGSDPAARLAWRDDPRTDEWTIESVEPHRKRSTRIL